MVRILLTLTLLSGCMHGWRTRDTVLEAAVVTTTVLDWSQTRYVTAHCAETNPIIGECGHSFNMHAYFLSALIVQAVAAGLMPEDYRSVFLGAWLGAETSTVWTNKQDGVPLFP